MMREIYRISQARMRDIYLVVSSPHKRLKTRMSYELFRRRIDAALEAIDATPNAASVAIGLDRGYVGKLGLPKNGTTSEPGALAMKNLARFLGVPTEWIVDAIDPDQAELAKGSHWPPGIVEGDGDLSQQAEGEQLLKIWFRLDRSVRNAALTLIRSSRPGPKSA